MELAELEDRESCSPNLCMIFFSHFGNIVFFPCWCH